jgi:hypothetical protein
MLTPAELSVRVQNISRDMRELLTLFAGAWVSIAIIAFA